MNMKKYDNIILIGMPASGKTTFGRQLAKILGWKFYDTDDWYLGLLPFVLKDIGAKKFLRDESRHIRSIPLTTINTVIATGGSAVLSPSAMRHLRRLGRVVYLEVDFPEVIKRIGNFEKRGVVDGFYLSDRIPLYEKWCHEKVRVTAND